MKKYHLLGIITLVFLLIVITTTGAFAKNQIHNKPSDINRLLKAGFTEDEIQNFTAEDYETFKDLKGKVISKDTKYFRVDGGKAVELTKEQALKEVREFKEKKKKNELDLKPSKDINIMSDGSDTETTPSWITLTTTVTDQSTSSNKEFFFKTSFEWLTNPVITLTDVVGMTKSSNISIKQDSERLKYTYDLVFESSPEIIRDTKSVYYNTASKKSDDGYAFKYDILSGDEGYQAVNHRGFMYYYGEPAPSNYIGPADAYGHYSHQILTSTISIGIYPGSISVTPTLAFEDAIDTHADFNVE